MNIHPAIDSSDPKFAAADAAAGGLGVQSDGHTHFFDWANPAQLAAYQNLQAPFEAQGVRAWWLDYCGGCGASISSDPHIGPDNLINQAYADHDTARGLRGFAFSRIGGTEHGTGDSSSFAVGPFSERRNSLAFTGDTYSTWDTLAYEVQYTAAEGAAGLTNVSHDIGGFHGGHLADDLYARWVQFDSRTVTVTAGSLPVGSAHTIGLTGSATDNPASGEVIGDGGLCLDVRGGIAADGQPVQLYTCNHTAAQQVGHLANDTVQVLGRCLTVNGTLVGTNACAGSAAQLWTRRADGSLLNPASGQCLDVPQGNTTPGAVQLQVFACNSSAAQVWRLPPGAITGPGGLCADVAGADPSSATAIQLYTCNNSDAQRWSAPGDGSLRAFGKCLDVANGGTANHTAVQLFDCNGTAAQTWTSGADGTLVNAHSGRCLDDTGDTHAVGDLLQIYDCDGAAAQQFKLH